MGPFRSGTSLTSQVLSALGVDFGPHEAFQLEPDRYNPGGYFQRRDVVEANTHLIEGASDSIAIPSGPEVILDAASADWRPGVDLDWTRNSPRFGLKDPRFCATLLTWLRRGALPAECLKIVRVVRDPEAIARSSVAHREVGSFCDYDLGIAESMARTYDARAAWHVSTLGIPAFEISYKELLSEPQRVIEHLALFVGESDQERLRRARQSVGKRRALMRHYAHKLSNPNLAFATARKTLKAWLRA
ncbi:hypothetical protein B1C78_07760 [Thioalkalivibrio denitrificans]|uniref:Sulfotransferase family protein n=2 Tax=Thioalkalivibrio denitrificans TaxID=108003 RepID=A0A1V3NJ35_9GAMM|nr:sulfotransferase [Thioalkalivibrio denitrificans]OOG24898.1 hypothetical protein B1C78_07760 [Thioalkalivibrio denitrificans]